MTFGLQCDEPASVAILGRAAAGGITFLDTADVYPVGGTFETVGRTEEILGRWLRGRRADFVVATKCAGAMEYLREAGIPFIAAWGVVPGATSGAHIHVGQPSPRLAVKK